jgi:ribosomal protein S18 acetylase RimI-like enzyme
VERLVRAAGAQVTLGTTAVHPDEDLADGAGRHYPAHLDVRPVLTAEDWWGAWWAPIHVLPRTMWPREAPERTFDLRRDRRDARRWRKEARRLVADAQIRRVATWRWTAELTDGTLLGFLVAAPRDQLVEVLHLEIHPRWRALGIGARLLDTLADPTTSSPTGSGTTTLSRYD